MAACIVGICSTSLRAEAPGAPVLPAHRIAAQVVDLTNAERVGKGRTRLRANPQLMKAAQVHAEQMARARTMAHDLPRARYPRATDRLAAVGYRWQTCGENVAFGQSGAEHVVNSWMKSRGHRRNILNPDFTEIGVGMAIDRAGRPYYVQVFGSPSAPDRKPSQTATTVARR